MGVALALTGWWMYIDVPETAKAVVICVIVFNAAFGYRCQRFLTVDVLILFTLMCFIAGGRFLGCTHLR